MKVLFLVIIIIVLKKIKNVHKAYTEYEIQYKGSTVKIMQSQL